MIDNLPARRTIAGEVDFTMMYAAHDAFSRHPNSPRWRWESCPVQADS